MGTREIHSADASVHGGALLGSAKRSSITTTRLQIGVAAAFALAALGLGTQLAATPESQGSFARFEGQPNLSPPTNVSEQEQAILRVVKPGRGLPPPGSVL